MSQKFYKFDRKTSHNFPHSLGKWGLNFEHTYDANTRIYLSFVFFLTRSPIWAGAEQVTNCYGSRRWSRLLDTFNPWTFIQIIIGLMCSCALMLCNYRYWYWVWYGHVDGLVLTQWRYCSLAFNHGRYPPVSWISFGFGRKQFPCSLTVHWCHASYLPYGTRWFGQHWLR